jgi:hypothetical protein
LIVDEFGFDYMTARARISFDDGKKDISGIANIRMAHDSIIWISLTPGLGVEVARVLIATDSVFFMDRINRNYLKLSYMDISKTYGFDISFSLIQSVVLGNLTYPYARQPLTKGENSLEYQHRQEDIVITNQIELPTRKLQSFEARDIKSNNSISVTYSDFKPVFEELLPFDIKAILDYQVNTTSKTTIEIGYNKANIEDKPLRFPFTIPSKYSSL